MYLRGWQSRRQAPLGKDGDDVKFGLAYNTAYYGADPDLMAAPARHAEECGFRVLIRA